MNFWMLGTVAVVLLGGRGREHLGGPEEAALMAENHGNPRDDVGRVRRASARRRTRPVRHHARRQGADQENQDHFLVATVHPELVIHETSLPAPASLPIHGTRLATVMLVADGVGGSTGGREASQLAIESIMTYVSSSLRCYHAAGSSQEDEFVNALRDATLEAHAAVRARGGAAARSAPDGDDAHAVHRSVAMGVRGAGRRQPRATTTTAANSSR